MKIPISIRGWWFSLLDRLIEPLDYFLHPSGRFKRCCGLKYHAQAFAVWSEGLDMVSHLLILATMILILGAVLEEHAVQLLDVIFDGRDSFIAIEDHIHHVGIASHFLLVAAGQRFGLHPGEQFLYFPVTELGAFDPGGRSHTFDSGYPPEAGQLFGSKAFNYFPAPLKLVDISDELQDFGRNSDVFDSADRANIHFHPFLPVSYSKARNIH